MFPMALRRSLRRRVVQCFTPQNFFHTRRYKLSCRNRGTDAVEDHVQYNVQGIKMSCPKQAFGVKSNWELFRGWMVFKTFTYDCIVDNSLKVQFKVNDTEYSACTSTALIYIILCPALWVKLSWSIPHPLQKA